MIIATIDNQRFILESLKDAEQLLGIFARANPVERSYDREYKNYFYPDHSCECGVEISSAKLVTLEEHQKRITEREEREKKSASHAATPDKLTVD